VRTLVEGQPHPPSRSWPALAYWHGRVSRGNDVGRGSEDHRAVSGPRHEERVPATPADVTAALDRGDSQAATPGAGRRRLPPSESSGRAGALPTAAGRRRPGAGRGAVFPALIACLTQTGPPTPRGVAVSTRDSGRPPTTSWVSGLCLLRLRQLGVADAQRSRHGRRRSRWSTRSRLLGVRWARTGLAAAGAAILGREPGGGQRCFLVVGGRLVLLAVGVRAGRVVAGAAGR
jgi:hypothetical protein